VNDDEQAEDRVRAHARVFDPGHVHDPCRDHKHGHGHDHVQHHDEEIVDVQKTDAHVENDHACEVGFLSDEKQNENTVRVDWGHDRQNDPSEKELQVEYRESQKN
jgi:hypothetical protein